MIPYVGFAVVNDRGHIVPCMDGGKTRHHVAVWDTMEQAELFADRMRKVPGNRDIVYSVVWVNVTDVLPTTGVP